MSANPRSERAAAESRTPYPVRKIAVDVLIIGSGPVGCTYAKKLYAEGRSILMIDAGAFLSRRAGEHLKNSFLYQRSVDEFASVIRGHLHTLSIPPNTSPVMTLDPGSFRGGGRNNFNPDQNPFYNLPASAAAYGVGGMATHWTCATPRQHPEIERSSLITAEEWIALYSEAETLLHTHNDQFEFSDKNQVPEWYRGDDPALYIGNSIRSTVVRETLASAYPNLQSPYNPQRLPLAADRRHDNDELVHWSGSDTILGELAGNDGYDKARFRIEAQHRCRRLVVQNGKVIHAEVDCLLDWSTVLIQAKTYIVAAGAVLTPQLLFNSNIRPQALGHYLSEQPMAFCQIVLRQEIVDAIRHDARFAPKVQGHLRKNPKDPIPIPMNDPEPQNWIPVSKDRPWHCQIHRDAFQYGDLAPNIDSRLVVDLRWFGIVKQRLENYVTFSEQNNDTFGMPQPTFHFELDNEERSCMHAMMDDMLHAASALGGFLPGSEPQFMSPGLTLHIHGTTRMGDDQATSVVDKNCKVWGFDNLYVCGNGIHPVGHACNPTLTSVACALKSAGSIR